jgi:hypothetical protein
MCFFQGEVQKKMVISYRFCFAVTVQKQREVGAIRNSFQGENKRSLGYSLAEGKAAGMPEIGYSKVCKESCGMPVP